MSLVACCSDLKKRVSPENLENLRKFLVGIDSVRERSILEHLRKTSLVIEDGEYQIPIRDEKDFHALKKVFSETSYK
jgi:hypothetical protein